MALDKLDRLGPRLFGEAYDDLDLAIESLEVVLPLSDSYRELLLEFGGAVIFEKGAKFQCDERSPLNDKEGFQSLEMLYGLGCSRSSILMEGLERAGQIPDGFVAIGESSGDHLICMDREGAIHLWEHKSSRDEKGWLIANSIDDFLGRLQPDDSATGNTDGIIDSESFLDF